MKIKRKMVVIDEDKCDGCGLCVPSCAEGALQIIDGKARLVSDVYCDGLGACLGDCPRDAITVEEREAEEYDQKAVDVHLEKIGRQEKHKRTAAPVHMGCPGMAVKKIERKEVTKASEGDSAPAMSSRLTNWPVQIKLVPPSAPYLQGAKLLIAADCVPMAYADFHRRFVEGRVALMGCPKLDDAQFYIEKLTMLFQNNDIIDVIVPHMEVPCCTGIIHIVKSAVEASGKSIPMHFVQIGINGEILNERTI